MFNFTPVLIWKLDFEDYAVLRNWKIRFLNFQEFPKSRIPKFAIFFPGHIKSPFLKCLKFFKIFKVSNKILGTEETIENYTDSLSKLGFKFNKKISVPSYRSDIMHQNDLAEEFEELHLLGCKGGSRPSP